jgi:hypothetical protein
MGPAIGSFLSQLNPVHTATLSFSKLHFVFSFMLLFCMKQVRRMIEVISNIKGGGVLFEKFEILLRFASGIEIHTTCNI